MSVVKVTSLLIKPESALGFIFGVRAQTEMKTWCVTGMCMLKVVSSETNLGVKGISYYITFKVNVLHKLKQHYYGTFWTLKYNSISAYIPNPETLLCI